MASDLSSAEKLGWQNQNYVYPGDPFYFSPGGNIGYMIYAVNNGDEPAQTITVTDTLPIANNATRSQVIYQDGSALISIDGGGYTSTGVTTSTATNSSGQQVVTFTIQGPVPPGGSIILFYGATVPIDVDSNAQLLNSASISSDGGPTTQATPRGLSLPNCLLFFPLQKRPHPQQ